MKERIFIKKAKEQIALENFIRKDFKDAKCGLIDVQHTPIMTRIIIYTTTPGLVIGSGGEKIRETMEVLKEKFKIENPQIDVQKIENPDLDPNIVAQTIATSLENNVNYKKLGNYHVDKILHAGALGCELVITGKIGGQRGRRERFIAGYIKKCGDTARKNVIEGFAIANPRLGNIGVHVKIMVKSLNFLVRPKLAPKVEDLPEETKVPEIPKVETKIASSEETRSSSESQNQKIVSGSEDSRDISEPKVQNIETEISKEEVAKKEAEPQDKSE